MRTSTLIILAMLIITLSQGNLRAGGDDVGADGPLKVICIDGNIHAVFENGTTNQLTSSGIDSMPCLSPDRTRLAFMRARTNDVLLTEAGNDIYALELWTMTAAGTHMRRVAEPGPYEGGKVSLQQLHDPFFANDAQSIYFHCDWMGPAPCGYRIDLATGRIQQVSYGKLIGVVTHGRYKDYLITCARKYWLVGGVYGYYTLLQPDGYEVAPPIGPSESHLEAFRKVYSDWRR